MKTITNKTVATEIVKQLGNKALCMLGAKQFSCTDNALVFRIGGNCKRVNCIKITLNGLDQYDMEFIRIWGIKLSTLAEHENVHVDSMHGVIESETGMRTSL